MKEAPHEYSCGARNSFVRLATGHLRPARGVDAVGVDRSCRAAYNGNGCAAGKRGAANRRGIF
jgi:hypothetical protein